MNPNNSPQYITPPPSFSDQSLQQPAQKSKLPIVIIAAVIIIIAAIAAIILIPQNTNDGADAPKQTPDSSESKSAKVTKIHERLNVSNSTSSFGGSVYDVDGNAYSLAEMKTKLDREDGNYFFPINPAQNPNLIAEDQWTSSSAVYTKMLDVFGTPNTIIESYRQLSDAEGEGYYGAATIIWHCDKYYVSMVVEDLTNYQDKNYEYPTSGIVVTMLQINTNTSQWSDLFNDSTYEVFGKENL